MCSFVEKCTKHPAQCKAPGAGIRRIERELRCYQQRIDVRLTDLTHQLLATQDIAFEPRAVAVQEYHEGRRARGVELRRHGEQHAPVAIGRVFPEHFAVTRGATAPFTVADIEEFSTVGAASVA